MLITPFRSKRSGLLLAVLLAVFFALFARYGVVLANDSAAYLAGGVRVSSLYPALIALFRAVFPEHLALGALVVFQEIFTAYAVFSLVSFLSERFSIRPPLSLLLALGFVGAYVLRLALVGPEALYCNTVLTEAIAYPLYFLLVKYAFAAWDGVNFLKLLTALLLALLLACTRGQMLFLLPALAVLFFGMLRRRAPEKAERRALLFRGASALAAFFVLLTLSSSLYHYAVSGVFGGTTMGRETVLGALLYNSDASDAALFDGGSEAQALFMETLTIGEAEGLTYQSAPHDPVGYFKHYEASHDELRDRLYDRLLLRHAGETVDDDALRLEIAAHSKTWIPALLRANFGQYLKTCAVNAFGGLVRTNSILRSIGVVWSALVYLLAAGCLLLAKRSAQLAGEGRFLAVILLLSLANAVFCAFGVFELSRYVYYNFPCIYLALALFLFRLLGAWRKKERLW